MTRRFENGSQFDGEAQTLTCSRKTTPRLALDRGGRGCF